jgi:uncharacterized protein (TIGR02466 family)
MESNIIKLFPTAILNTTIGRDFTEKEMLCVESYREKHINPLEDDSDLIQDPNTFIKEPNDLYVLDNENFSELKCIIENALKEYLIKVYNPINPHEVKICITHSWLNFTKIGHYHRPHVHHNSFVSGCVYIKAKKDFDGIIFVKPDTEENWQIQPKADTEFTMKEKIVPVERGDLVIFPSNLTHGVATIHNEDRISLAFNTYLKGKIGFVEGPMKGINFLNIELDENQKQFKPL